MSSVSGRDVPPGRSAPTRQKAIDKMTQTVPETPTRGRAANRIKKRQEYIDTAIRIVLKGGLEALTMQALAREMGAAVGTAYTYFASKSALVAELQVLAVGRLVDAYNAVAPAWIADLGDLDERGRAEAGLNALVEFTNRAPIQLRDDTFLQQLLFTDGGRSILPEDQATVIEAAGAWTEIIVKLLADASAAGALSDGDIEDRSVKLVAALNGANLYNNLPEGSLSDIPAVARGLVVDLLSAWGGDHDRLSASADAVATAANSTEIEAPELV